MCNTPEYYSHAFVVGSEYVHVPCPRFREMTPVRPVSTQEPAAHGPDTAQRPSASKARIVDRRGFSLQPSVPDDSSAGQAGMEASWKGVWFGAPSPLPDGEIGDAADAYVGDIMSWSLVFRGKRLRDRNDRNTEVQRPSERERRRSPAGLLLGQAGPFQLLASRLAQASA